MAYSDATKATVAEMEEKIKQVKEADKVEQEANKTPKRESPTTRDLQGIARKCAFEYFIHNGEPTLHYWQSSWWRWVEGKWSQTTKDTLSGLIAAYATMPSDADEDSARGLGMSNLGKLSRDEVLMFMRPLLTLPDHQDFQTWLPAYKPGKDDLNTKGTWVNTTTGLLRIADREKDDSFKIQATPRYFTPCVIPRKFDVIMPSRWVQFLDEIFEGDQECVNLLQEWFGYCCLPTTRFQKMMLMIGDGSNGKSVVLHVLKQMLGKANCSSATLTQLNQRFGLVSTFGKLANICGDVATKYLKDPAELKAFIGGDDMEFERKFCDAFSSSPTARIVFSMNRVPKTDDDSHGWWRRLLILPFTFSPETEDPLLASPGSSAWPFRAELDQIFTWSLQGLVRALNQDGFSLCEASLKTLDQWRLMNENVRRYKEERLHIEGDASWSTPVCTIYTDYENWCASLRIKPYAVPEFGHKLHTLRAGIKVIQKKFGEKELRHWVGIRVAEKAPSLPAASSY